MSAPGWYPDPLGGRGARYWDGNRWDGAIQSGPPTTPQECPELAPKTEKSRRLWPLWVGMGVTVAIAVGSALFVLTRPARDIPKSAPPTPTTQATSAAASATPPTPTSPPASDVARRVKTLMQDHFDTDPKLRTFGLKIVDVSLVHKVGNEYRGTATISGPGGTLQTAVDVTADGSNIMWEIDSDKLNFTPTSTAAPRAGAVPGADEFGFFDGPRCSRLDVAAIIVRTSQSEAVVCRGDGPNLYFYKGLRLSDGGEITLSAVPSANGFIATNPSDGTQYAVTLSGLTITTGTGETFREPAIASGP
ncbi:DUF2510 domain-containing protein [Mycolicibacterium sp. ELW1]|uniref:DUF2510 domain-containing protein n=2 Tax=Mycobacteriaceae TaxID=1762 RepID=UPI0011EF884E|nr:DUF2510 domain-containing protein [Mycobacterium sp. ELW1]